MNIFIKILVFILIFSILLSTSSLLIFATEAGINNISAKSACLIEAESGKVLYSNNSTTKMPMASTTKVMTAIVALESNISLDADIQIPQGAVGIEGSSAYLRYNEKVKFEVLLYALLLASANDAAVALAYATAGSIDKFVELMNLKAQTLGLLNTNFTNPHGLYDVNHYTTAEDLAKIMAYAIRNPNFSKITSCQKFSFLRDDGTSFLFVNHNRLLKTYDGVIGGKTGFTKKSGRCLVSWANRDGLNLIAVTLNAPDDWNDHAKLYDFGFSNYERVYFESINVKTPVISGNKSEVLLSSNAFSIVLPKSCATIKIQINTPRFLFAQIKKNEKIGNIHYYKNGKLIATSPLYSQEDVELINYKFNLFEWIIEILKGIFI